MKTTIARQTALAFVAGTLAIASIAAAETPKASVVYERYFAALGGRAEVTNVDSLVVKGVGQEGQSSFDFELTLKAPGLIRLTATNPRGLNVSQGRDSKARCWRKDGEGVKDLDGKDAGELMDLALAYHLPSHLGLSERLADAVCEEDRDGDRALVAIGKKGRESAFPRLLFDAASGLLVQVGRVKLDDYRKVDNLRLPFSIRAGEQAVLRVDQIRLNPVIDPAVFAKPEGKDSANAADGRAVEAAYRTLVSAAGKLEIVRRSPPANYQRGQVLELPRYNPSSSKGWQVDVRSRDLSRLDLRDRLNDLLHADFDSVTRWPEKLPAGFDAKRIVQLGADPGLGVRKLHARGLTGKGVAVGIIDQTLLVDHVEYRDRLRLYEEIHSPAEAPAQMHGPAVASIAVGKTVGVAPEAELYYIAETHGVFRQGGDFDWDFTWLAQSIHRLLDVNAMLPAERKLRVISISVGWSRSQTGYTEAMAAVDRARKENVFVVSTAIEECYHLAFHGLGREALADPNEFASFGPGSWWADSFWGGQRRFASGTRLLVPMDARATASPTGPEDYVYYSGGGWSWSVPWIAGLYAVACQADPAITPRRFWAEALKTGRTIRITKDGEQLEFGTIADPVALLAALQPTATSAR